MHIINEVLLSIVSFSFLALTITLILAIRTSTKKIDKMEKDFTKLSDEGTKLVQICTELSEDLTKKSASLNFVFEFLDQFNQEPAKEKQELKISDVAHLIGESIAICKKINGEIKKYVKS